MKITFFKTGRPKQFNFIPRYYDEQKEEAENRRRRIATELGIEDKEGGYKTTLRKGVIADKITMSRKAKRYSAIRLLVIIAILSMLMLYLLSGDFSFNFLSK